MVLCVLVFALNGCNPFIGRDPRITPSRWPVAFTSPPVSSSYGIRFDPLGKGIRHHDGIDIAVDTGTCVYATADGRVIFAGADNGLGKYVKIDHGDELYTYYGHLSKTVVKEGDNVRRGQLIAYSGNTGRTTGDHLHYQIKYRGSNVNPKWTLP